MAKALATAWEKLTLTEEEAIVAVFDEAVPAEKVEEIALSMVGKLMCDGPFNEGDEKCPQKYMEAGARGGYPRS